ncbi:MAG: hypothetical protein AAB583_06765 [Patescibacteria group bacterium]
MKRILIISIVFVLFFSQLYTVYGATRSKKTSAPSVSTSAQFIKAKNAVRVFFGNLKGVGKITYVVTYSANGINQGIEGSLIPGKKTSLTSMLYLGTCSGKDCISHKNIKNIQLEAKIKYTNGKTLSKIYKVK